MPDTPGCVQGTGVRDAVWVPAFGGGATVACRRAKHRKRSGGRQPSEQEGSGLAIAVGALLDGIPESIVIPRLGVTTCAQDRATVRIMSNGELAPGPEREDSRPLSKRPKPACAWSGRGVRQLRARP
jgi:hypothetical protein